MSEMMMTPTNGNNLPDNNQLQKLMKEVAATLVHVADKLGDADEKIEKTNMAVSGINDKVQDLSTDVADLKENQFVEPWQDAAIQRAARIRVSTLLKIKWEDGGVAEESARDYKLYFGKFCQALHREAKRIGLEGPKIHQTKRKDYEKLIEFIGQWVPIRGVEGQKAYYDMLSAH